MDSTNVNYSDSHHQLDSTFNELTSTSLSTLSSNSRSATETDHVSPGVKRIEDATSDAELESESSSSEYSSANHFELKTPSSDVSVNSEASSSPLGSRNSPEEVVMVKEVPWEDRAQARISRMIERESRTSLLDPTRCAVDRVVKYDMVQWILKFELCMDGYPSIPFPTRYRATTLFSRFWALCPSLEGSGVPIAEVLDAAWQIGVACLMLACKADIDCHQPLFSVTLDDWVEKVNVSGWVPIDAISLEVVERDVLSLLSYDVTFFTPFDFLAELAMASPQLARLKTVCTEDWEFLGDMFKIILERAVKAHDHAKYSTVMITAASLFLSLEGSVFDHPLEKTFVQGRQWSRDPEGTWTESIRLGSSKTVRIHVVSEALRDATVEIVQEEIQASICQILGLTKRQVARCQRWCASL